MRSSRPFSFVAFVAATLWIGALSRIVTAQEPEAPQPYTVPESFTSIDMQSADPLDRELHIVFPPTMELLPDLTLLNIRSQTEFIVSSERRLAFGLKAFIETMCSGARTELGPSCISQVNTSVLKLQLGQAKDFDNYATETVILIFRPSLFSSIALQGQILTTFSIVPLDLEIPLQGYFLTSFIGLTTTLTAFILPATMDAPMLITSTELSCATHEQKTWQPYAIWLLMPLGTTSYFQRLLITVGVFTSLLLLVFGILKLQVQLHIPLEVVQKVRNLFPFVFLQITLFCAPGFFFASGYMMSSNDAPEEIVGVLLLFAMVITMYAVHGWLFRNNDWSYFEWVAHTTTPKSPRAGGAASKSPRAGGAASQSPKPSAKLQYLDPRAHGVQKTCFDIYIKNAAIPEGAWRHDQDPVLANFFLRRITGPRNDALAPIFWLVVCVFYLLAGFQSNSPIRCFAQHTGLAILNAILLLLLWKLKLFRSKFLTVFAVLFHCTMFLQYIVLAFPPLFAQEVTFNVLNWAGATILLMRVGYVLFILRGYDLRLYEQRSETAALQVPLFDEDNWDDVPEGDEMNAAVLIDAPPEGNEKSGALGDDECAWDDEQEKDGQMTSAQAALNLQQRRGIRDPSNGIEYWDDTDSEGGGSSVAVPSEEGGDDPRHENNSDDGQAGGRTFSEYASTRWTANEAPWIATASRHRPRKAFDPTNANNQNPTWFPKERPNVRTENVADIPLKESPYSTRSKPSRLPKF